MGQATKMSSYKLTSNVLAACLKAAQMWCAAHSGLNENVNEGLLVSPADDIPLEIVLNFIISNFQKSVQ